MDSNRTVASLDAHKDSVYLCIMGYDKTIIFQKTYGVADSTTSHSLRQNSSFHLCVLN